MSILLAGCGSNASSQDIATGEDFHLPRAEFAHILSQLQSIPDRNAPGAQKEVLNRLIDEKLLANAAIKDGLDRQNDTVLQIEAARRSALARAYLMKAAQAVPLPNDAEIARYYESHPASFSNRVMVSFEQTRFSGDAKTISKYRDALAQDDTVLPALIGRAEADKIVAASSRLDKSSDQLPAATASRLSTAKVGDSFLNASADMVELIKIGALNPAPLSFDQAKPLIRDLIVNQRKDEVAKAEVKRLREQAKIRILDPQLAR